MKLRWSIAGLLSARSSSPSLFRMRACQKTLCAAVLACVGLGFGSPAHATLVSLDFNVTGGETATGDGYAGVLAGQTGNWNTLPLGTSSGGGQKNYTTPSILDMLDGNGVATTVDFYLNTVSAMDKSNPGPTTTSWRSYNSSAGGNLRGDIFYLTNANVADTTSDLIYWVIEGLVPNASYNLAFFGQAAGTLEGYTAAGRWSIGGDSLENWNGSAVTGGVQFNAIIADGNGIIGGSFERTSVHGTAYSAWSGLQIQAVPEPGSFAMLLFGSVTLWAAGRKRR